MALAATQVIGGAIKNQQLEIQQHGGPRPMQLNNDQYASSYDGSGINPGGGAIRAPMGSTGANTSPISVPTTTPPATGGSLPTSASVSPPPVTTPATPSTPVAAPSLGATAANPLAPLNEYQAKQGQSSYQSPSFQGSSGYQAGSYNAPQVATP